MILASIKKNLALGLLFFTITLQAEEVVNQSHLSIFDTYLQQFIHSQEAATKPLSSEDAFKAGIRFEERQPTLFETHLAAAKIVTEEIPNAQQTADIVTRLNLLEPQVMDLLGRNLKTNLGRACFVKQLHKPTTDKSSLLNRSAALEELSNSEQLYSEITKIYTDAITPSEKNLFAFFNSDSELNKKYFESLYFSIQQLKKFNKNSTILEAAHDAELGLKVAAPVLYAGFLTAEVISGVYLTLKLAQKNPYAKTNVETQFGITIPAKCSNKELLQLSIKGAKNLVKNAFSSKFMKAYACFTAVYMGYTYYSALREMFWKKQADIYLQKRLIDLRNFIAGAEQLKEIVSKSKALSALPELSGLAILENNEQSLEFQELLRLLATPTFDSASIFSSSGRIRAAHALVSDCLPELKKIAASVAALDVLTATSGLLKPSNVGGKLDQSNVGAKFTLPHFIFDATSPFIEAKEFWNPALSRFLVVPNDLIINGSSAHPLHTVVTGPNTGGKTTVLKSLMVNAWLAQTIGIVPASSLLITPFTTFNCYLNITDDISSGQSLFAAEVNRIKRLVDSIASLKQNEFGFAVLDEIFTGTAAHEASQAAVMFLNKIVTFKNCITLTATHFPDLTKVSGIKNYQVTVNRDNDGLLVRPFKLEEGVSTINIAFDVMKQNGLFDALEAHNGAY